MRTLINFFIIGAVLACIASAQNIDDNWKNGTIVATATLLHSENVTLLVAEDGKDTMQATAVLKLNKSMKYKVIVLEVEQRK